MLRIADDMGDVQTARVTRFIYMTCYAKELSQWKYLTNDERAAAMLLGWDCQIWNEGMCPLKGELLWRALSDEEKNAGMMLGYNEQLWDTEVMREYYV